MTKIVFKELTSNQNVLFPVSLSEKIAPNHPVRVVNSVVDALDISCLLWSYKGGGTSSYHPRMMLKVLFYAYLNNIYSCRKIEKALQENIHFMWLSGNSTPDFRTINDFRGKRLKEHIKSLFSAIVLLLQESGYVSLDVQYIDGTKVESASNRYTFVWRGSVEKNKTKLESKNRRKCKKNKMPPCYLAEMQDSKTTKYPLIRLICPIIPYKMKIFEREEDHIMEAVYLPGDLRTRIEEIGRAHV